MNVRGVELELYPPPDYLSDEVRRTGDFFEAEVLDAVRDRLAGTEPGVLVDVGAMIGNHTAYLTAFAPPHIVHAFEPHPANFALLRRNAPLAFLHRVALADYDGPGHLAVDQVNPGHSALAETGIAVTVRTLDSYDLREVRLVKVDVEGGEEAVLRGAARTIAESRPLILIEDWTGEAAVAGYELTDAWPDRQTYLWEPA